MPGSIAGLFLTSMLVMLGVGILVPLLGVYARDLGAGGTALGVLYGAFALSRAVTTPVVARVSDRVDKRLVILGGLILLCVLAFLYLRTSTVGSLLVVRIAHGVSSAMIIPVALARVAELAPESREGEVMGTYSISIVLGMALGPSLGGLLYEAGGYDLAFTSVLALAVAALVIVAVAVPGRGPGGMPRATSLRRILVDPLVTALAACRLLTAACIATQMAYLPIYAAETGVGVGRAGLLITLGLLTSAGAQRFLGKLADRTSRIGLVVGGILLLGAVMSLLPVWPRFEAWLVLAILTGVARAMIVAAGGALLATLGREHGAGSVMGVVNVAMSLGLGLGPVLAGVAMERFGLRWAFPAVGLCAMIGAMAAALVWVGRQPPRQVEATRPSAPLDAPF